jgi:hypothetical protein
MTVLRRPEVWSNVIIEGDETMDDEVFRLRVTVIAAPAGAGQFRASYKRATDVGAGACHMSERGIDKLQKKIS